jgi:hypothetical protein
MGLVAGGRLEYVRGLGEWRLGGQPPDHSTVFRIASMTKSFTAAAVLALRDDPGGRRSSTHRRTAAGGCGVSGTPCRPSSG